MCKRQRLILCLDGTWNTRDSSTNVLHHFELVREGEVECPKGGHIIQKKYYHKGVGTSRLDYLTGGGFGFGLEQNVRDAYNWLVQHYQEENESEEADEIFVFGFSRGAYTARSLAGFIGRCGLLRRGAPLTVRQLWEAYCILGREHEQRHDIWDKLFGKDPVPTRQITELVCDPWEVAAYEKNRAETLARKGPPIRPDGEVDADRVPGQRAEDLTETELLLVRWSRRVRITYLGLYDTVGAIGFDALAIPGLKSRLALHHNMRPTTLIQSCRHALALDENRSSFSYTPFVAYVGHGAGEEQLQRGAQPDAGSVPEEIPAARRYWERNRAMWWRKIEQRWFAGAHSNIGGGYENNRLAQIPFQWVLKGAQDKGLQYEALASVTPLPDPLPPPRDSYAEFVRPLWTTLLRAKRWYRPVSPVPELRASGGKKPVSGAPCPAGFSLVSINEQVDPSVLDCRKDDPPRPNLVAGARRILAKENALNAPEKARSDLPTGLKGIAEKKPAHPWLGRGLAAHVGLVLWAALAAMGCATMYQALFARPWLEMPLWVLCAVAFVFTLLDWAESRLNFALAAGRDSPSRRAFLGAAWWLRALGVVLCVCGGLAACVYLWMLGWTAGSLPDAWSRAVDLIGELGWVALCAGAGLLLPTLFEWKHHSRPMGLAAVLAGPLAAVVGALVIVLFALLCATILAPIVGRSYWTITPAPDNAHFAGLLLLLQMAVVCFANATPWVGEPLTKANLGSIVPLQFCCTPRQVQARLEKWRRSLACRWLPENEAGEQAAAALREILREALWRDSLGYIPLYFLMLVLGLWFAAAQLGWVWLGWAGLGLPLWLLVPLVAAVADYGENTCHLRYVALDARKLPPPAWLSATSFLMTCVKFLAFAPAMVLTLAALCSSSYKITWLTGSGWRGTLALGISVTVALALLALLIGVAWYRLHATRVQARQPRRASAQA